MRTASADGQGFRRCAERDAGQQLPARLREPVRVNSFAADIDTSAGRPGYRVDHPSSGIAGHPIRVVECGLPVSCFLD